MARLPNAEKAIVPEAKITRYLLDLTSEQGKSKAQFFILFGFTMSAWELLAAALRQHGMTHEVADHRETRYGIHYVVDGSLQTPDGRRPQVRSVWKIETGDTVPSLVTAYPLEEVTDDETL
jgi:hypothetical protein